MVVITFPTGAVSTPMLLRVRRLERGLVTVPALPEDVAGGDTLLEIELATLDGRPAGGLLR